MVGLIGRAVRRYAIVSRGRLCVILDVPSCRHQRAVLHRLLPFPRDALERLGAKLDIGAGAVLNRRELLRVELPEEQGRRFRVGEWVGRRL